MKNRPICPFYGKSEKFCDVGCGYIFPHDVNLIIKYCSCRYGDCLKYRELADRFPEEDGDRGEAPEAAAAFRI